MEWTVYTPSIQWINFTTFTLNAVNEWWIDYISLTSFHPSLRVFHSIHFMKWNEITRCAGRFPFVTLMVPFGPCFSSFNSVNFTEFNTFAVSYRLQLIQRAPFASVILPSLRLAFCLIQPFRHSCCVAPSFHQLHFVNWMHEVWIMVPDESLHYQVATNIIS